MRLTRILFSGVLAMACGFAAQPAAARDLSLSSVNDAELSAASRKQGAAIIKAQVLLDRAALSPGVIDGHDGDNFRKALAVFEELQGLKVDGRLDKETWARLTGADTEPVLTTYEITKDDVKGPFVERIPDEFEKLAEMERLAYTGPAELLAEKFHMDQDLLQALNRGAKFGEAGTKIVVAAVESEPPAASVAKLVVDKTARAVRALGEGDRPIAFYPATIGSVEKPAPTGEYEVRAFATNPTYTYDPKFAFKGVKAEKPLTIPPGPNSPVGSVWIDLTKETYGIHGTPEPAKVGKTFSHGCIRLTNWDVEELVRMVRKGTPVVFTEDSTSAIPGGGAVGGGKKRAASR